MSLPSDNGADTLITQPSIPVNEGTFLRPRNRPDIANFDFHQYTASKTNIITAALEIAVRLQNPIKIHEAMTQSLLKPGDKHIRALLCLAACDLFGGDDKSTAIPIACAVEMIHSFADAKPGRNSQKGFEEATKILASCSLFSLAFKNVAAKTGNVNHPQRVVRVFAELASAVGSKGFLAGELADLCSEGKGEVGTVAELEYIHVLKTARIFEAAVVCGAIMGGGDGAEIERLRMYGRYIGLLSEVVDDILDATNSSEKQKKTAVGKGLVSNTWTYPRLMGLEKAKLFAAELAAKAVEELRHFDAFKAAPLYYFADYVASCSGPELMV